MNDEATLRALKTDLGIKADAYNERLVQYLESAKAAIKREGITLTDDLTDMDLVVRYAAWLWRKRAEDAPLPRSLRWQLNNRLFSEKAGGDA